MTISKVADSKVERNKQMATALRYAKAGIPTFPVRNKQPLTQNGFKDATADVAVIRLHYQRWPDAGVAIPTGQASGRIILDLDNRTGAFEGRRAWERLQAENEPCPDTPEVITPSGGTHLVFKAPGGVRIPCSAGKLGEGIDVRGDGGYAVAPPSPGYDWDNAHHPLDVQPADIPPWLLRLLQAPDRNGPPTRATGPDELEKVPAGKRNSTITSHIGRMRKLGYVREELHGFARIINDFRCDPPLPDDEVRKIVESVCGYERGHFEMGADISEVEARAQRSGTLQSATARALAHPRARKLTLVATRLAAEIDRRKKSGEPPDTEDGLFYVSKDIIGGHDWRTDNWQIKETTVRNHTEELRGYAQHIPGFRAAKRPINFPKKAVDLETGEVIVDSETGEPKMVDRYEMTWCYSFDGDPAQLVAALPSLPYPDDGRGKRCTKCGAEKRTKTVEYCPDCEVVQVVPNPEGGGGKVRTPPLDTETGGHALTPIVDTDGSIPMGARTYPPAPASAWDSVYDKANQSTPKLESPAAPNITPELQDLADLIEVLLTGDYQLGRDVAQLAGATGDPEADCEKAVVFLISQGRAHRYASGLIVATVDPLAPLSIPKHPENAL